MFGSNRWFRLSDQEQVERFRREGQPLERRHLELRTALRDVQAALRMETNREELKVKAGELQEELAALERLAPWITADVPVELALWGPECGPQGG